MTSNNPMAIEGKGLFGFKYTVIASMGFVVLISPVVMPYFISAIDAYMTWHIGLFGLNYEARTMSPFYGFVWYQYMAFSAITTLVVFALPLRVLQQRTNRQSKENR